MCAQRVGAHFVACAFRMVKLIAWSRQHVERLHLLAEHVFAVIVLCVQTYDMTRMQRVGTSNMMHCMRADRRMRH